MSRLSSRQTLVDVAAGRLAPTAVIRHVMLVNTLSREIHPATILIHEDRIAAVLPEDEQVPIAPMEIDGEGRYAVPGLIDPHLHTESSAVSLAEFARAVVPRGVSTIICDPHEYGNILGRPGIELLLEEARHIPLTVKLRVPPRVPEMAAELETTGASLSLEDTLHLLDMPEAACLAGDINPEFFLGNDPRHAMLIEATIKRDKTVSGFAHGLSGRSLNAYIASGAEDSHAPADVSEVIEDLRLGLNVFLTPRPRLFNRKHFRILAERLASQPFDTRRLCLCTDDVPADRLLSEGHLDHRLRMAIEEGLSPLIAIQMATINPAYAMRIERDHGSISAGKFADLSLVSDLRTLSVSDTVYHGRHVVQNRLYMGPPSSFKVPVWAKETIRLDPTVEGEQLIPVVSTGVAEVECNAMVTGSLKELRRVTLPVVKRRVTCDATDIVHVAVLDRYSRSNRVGKGFALGTGIRKGALASSVNHNAHNIFALGRDPQDMAIALNQLIRIGGGYVVVCNGDVVGQVRLPVIGMISELPLEAVAAEFREAEQAVHRYLGCENLPQPLLSLSFVCAPVVPYVGITDMGIINTRTFQLEPTLIAAE
jgi:adenine deaminase